MLNICATDYTTFAMSGKVGPIKPYVNHTSWMTVVALTDRFCRSVIVMYPSIFVASLCSFDS